MGMLMDALEGGDREIAEALAEMDGEQRDRILDAVYGKVHGRPPYLTQLQTYEPAMIWSSGRLTRTGIKFYTRTVGQYDPDLERYLDWPETDMLCAGQLGYPLEFTRREIRIYPWSADFGRMDLLAEFSCLTEWVGVMRPFERGSGKVQRRPLPLPANPFNAERAKKLRERVNVGELSCLVWDLPPYQIGPVDAILLDLQQKFRMKPGEQDESWNARSADAWERLVGTELTCVMLGPLRAPVTNKSEPS